MSFEQLREKYLPQNNFFKYLQIFITSAIKLYSNGFSILAVEGAIRNLGNRKLITRFYRALSLSSNDDTVCARSLWEADLGEAILDDEWKDV